MANLEERFSVGQTYRDSFKIDRSIIEDFASMYGDRNPIHLDEEQAKAYGYPRQIAHGTILAGFLSRMIGMEVPGPGAVWMSQSIDWLRPVFAGDEIQLTVTVDSLSLAARILSLSVSAKNQRGETVMEGRAKVKAAERLSGARINPTEQRVALVTGGSRGIGSVIARRLGVSGMVVAVNYRESRESAEQVVQEILDAGCSAQAFAADIADPAATLCMIQEVIGSYGRLDVIVHGASPKLDHTKVGVLRYLEIEPYLKTYLGGCLALVEGASPGMSERKFGRFIFLGTSYMFGAPPVGLAAYVAAKHALFGLVRSMATELGPAGITSNMVSPGMTISDLTADIPIRHKEVEARKSPMRRLATAEDTAELVRYLSSEEAGYMNGANLPVTGGPI